MKLFGLNKLSKEKRNQLILVLVVTVIVLAGVWFGLVNRQNGVLEEIARKKAKSETEYEQMRSLIKRGPEAKAEAESLADQLEAVEANMASGDVYSWFLTTLRRFKQSYNVEIPQVSQPSIAETTLLPKFPYKQATLSLGGTARFHDLGRFIADFENKYPYIRILNLELSPAASGTESDTLAFKFDVVMLVKSS